MTTLEQEAEENYPLLDSSLCRTGAVEEENLQLLGHRKSFISGAKSKCVKAEKIQAEIDGLVFSLETPSKALERIEELNKKLENIK